MSAVLQDRHAFAVVQKFYEQGDLSDLGELVLKEAAAYYKRDPEAEYADDESILTRLIDKYPKHEKAFTKFINNMQDVSVANILEDYCNLKRKACSELAGSYLVAGEHDKAEPLLAKYKQLTEVGLEESDNADGPKIYQGAHAEEFTESMEHGNRIPMLPAALNKVIGGGLVAGCHLLLYAPPECGKTATAINTAYGFANAGKLTMYFGNEESADMYLNRMLCRFCRWPLAKVLKNKDAATRLAKTRGWDNLIFVHLSPGSIPQVQELILEYMPDVVVIDQLSNLTLNAKGGGKEPEKTQLLEKLAYTMRMFYSKHKIAGVSLSQADEKAIGKLYLTIKDVYYSNVGVQGQYDVMIGIGMDDNYQQMGRRVLNVTKNKLGGEHSAVIVQLVAEVSMLRGIGDD
jgi:archaellum biogenesis ATPase FlaH